MNADDWKAGFQAALTQYFYSAKFFVFSDTYYGEGEDHEATDEMRAHFGDEHAISYGYAEGHCEVDLAASDTVADMTEYNHTYFVDTDAPSGHKVLLTAYMTCRCKKYERCQVALEDSLSNAIQAIAKS